MGLDISKIVNAELKRIAYIKDDGDGNLNKEEFNLFKQEAAKVNVSAEDFNQAMGLYVTNPSEKAVPVTKTETENKQIKLNKYEKECKNAVLDNIKAYKDKQSITLSNLVEILKKDFSNNDYQRFITEVQEVVDYALATDFNSKDDVKALKKKIEKEDNFNKFQKSLAEEIVKFAKKEQIAKETAVLMNYYNDIAKEEKSGEENFSARLAKVKEKMESDKLKNTSYFSDEAYDALEAQVAEEVKNKAYLEMANMEYDKVSFTKKKQIKNAVKDKLSKSDDFAREVVGKMDVLAGVELRRLNYEKNFNTKLPSLSKDDLRDELGKSTFHILNSNFLEKVENEDGTYNLQVLADIIKGATGADWEMNSYEDAKKSEMQEAIDNLKGLIERGDLKESQVEKLKKLCKIEDAPKSRNVKEAFLGDAEKSATKGAIIGTALGFIDMEQIQEAHESIVDLVQRQSIKVPMWASIPAAIATEFILDGIANLIFGMEKGERTCFNYEKAEGKTIEEYIDHLSKTEDETKAKAIAVLAKMYSEKYGENWNTEFVKDMKELAGNDVLNCKEFFIGKLGLTKKLENAKNEEKVKTEEHVYKTRDVEGIAAEYEEVPTIDARRSSWTKLAGQYECLNDIDTTGLPLCTKRKAQLPVRILKVAQAITDGNYSLERMLQLAELTFASPNTKYENLKGIEGIDHAVLVNIMNADWLSASVKMPKQLAGCDRNESVSIIASRANTNGAKNAPVASANDRIQTSAGQDAEYYATFDNDAEKKYTTNGERQKDIDNFIKKYGKDNVSKK